MFYVGAGKAAIDPEPDLFPIPTHFNVVEEKYNSCYCRAVAMQNEERQLIFIVYELSDYPRIGQLHEKIANAAGCKAEDIVILVTHNHTSPCDENIFMDSEDIREKCDKYFPVELNGGIAACKQALANLRPAKIAYTTVPSEINVNRDLLTFGGYWVEGPNPKGFSDKTLSIIKFVDEEDRLIACILNHCTHATCTYEQKDVDGKKKMSGNFPGITCDFIENYYGNGSVAIWTSGAAGDQGPYLMYGAQLDYPDGYTTCVDYPDGTGFLFMEYLGRTHAVDAIRGMQDLKPCNGNIRLKHVVREINLPRQRHAGGIRHVQFKAGGHGNRRESDTYRPCEFPDMERVPDDPVPVRLELIVINDIAVICVGAEIYCHIGAEIKAASPYKNTFVMTHCYYHVGYVLDRDSADHKVFQSFNEVVPGESEGIILGCVEEMFRSIREEPQDVSDKKKAAGYL